VNPGIPLASAAAARDDNDRHFARRCYREGRPVLLPSVACYFRRVALVAVVLTAGSVGTHLAATGSAGPRDPVPGTITAAVAHRPAAQERAWEAQLARAPEVSLQSTRDRANPFERQGDAHPVFAVFDRRADLRGLPVLRGDDCQGPAVIGRAATDLRRALTAANHYIKSAGRGAAGPDDLPSSVRRAIAVAAEIRPSLLRQLCQCEGDELRGVMIALLRVFDNPNAAEALAHAAVFDEDAEIRAQAVAALRARSPALARPIFLDAFSHPWPAAAEYAADALVALDDRGALPELTRLLDGPDPAGPVTDDDGTPVVRELVRLNHARNCQLCHAPSWNQSDLSRAAVPSPDLPLQSPLSETGYTPDCGGPAVRIDVTYLRPDFSRMLPVADHDPWPKMQRFDFLVRTRPATSEEQSAARPGPSPQRDAALRAARSLRGDG
jgi:hypothetical protein